MSKPGQGGKFLNLDEIDYVLASALLKFKDFSHEELSSLYQLTSFLFSAANRPFTPFYDDGRSLNNQVLQGLVYQIGLRPPLFKVNPSATARKRIENKTKEICGDTYQAYKELIDDLSEVKDKRKWLKRIEIASVAYDELIENKKPDIAEGDEFLHKIRTYVEKFKGAVP